MLSLLWPGVTQWRIYYHWTWGQVSTTVYTCSNATEVAQWAAPSLSRKQPATVNGVNDGRSNWLGVAPHPSQGSIFSEFHLRGANAGYKSWDLLQPVGHEHATFGTPRQRIAYMRLLRVVSEMHIKRIHCHFGSSGRGVGQDRPRIDFQYLSGTLSSRRIRDQHGGHQQPSPAAVTRSRHSSRHQLPSPAAALSVTSTALTSSRQQQPSPAAVTSNRHQQPSPAAVTSSRHQHPSPAAITSSHHQQPSPAAITSSRHQQPSPAAVTSSRHQPSMMSNVSGAWASMLGCSADGNFQALKRTPATNSPGRPVGVIGTTRPLHAIAWRWSFRRVAFTCRRSTDEST